MSLWLPFPGKIHYWNTSAQHYHSQSAVSYPTTLVCPLWSPADRIRELKGSVSLLDMSSFSKLGLEELKYLIDHPDSEPTATQLIKLSVAYRVSVLWILGYHTSRDYLNEPIHSALVAAIVRRDAIDATARRLKKKGFMASYNQEKVRGRSREADLRIRLLATELTQSEHFPLSTTELELLRGRPVWVEPCGDSTEHGIWAICGEKNLYAAEGVCFQFNHNGYRYNSYLLP